MRISIVTATLQAERYLSECLQSVQSQEAPGVEIEQIVVDGGSTDSTLQLAAQAGCRTLTGKDSGVYEAMNKGARMAGGEILGFLNSDDVLLPGALPAVAEWFRRRKARWVVGGMRWMDGSGQFLGTTAAPPAALSQRIYASLGWSCIWHPSTYMTRDLFDELGGFDTSFRYSGDYDLLCRALGREPFDRIDRPLTAFRCHESNLSLSASPRLVAENTRITEEYAPASRLRRTLYRQMLRSWLNFRNPAWLLGKKAPRLAHSLAGPHRSVPQSHGSGPAIP